MSRWRAVVLLCVCASVAAAQDRAVYRARVDSLLRRYQAAHARHQAWLDSLRVGATKDTLVVGPLRIALAAPEHRELATLAADSALRILRPMYGRALEAMRSHTLHLRNQAPHGRRGPELVLSLVDPQGRETRARWGAVEEDIQISNFRDVIVQILSDASLHPTPVAGGYDPAALRAWLGSGFPLDSPRTSEYRAVRAELLTSTVSLARRCYDGSIAACRIGLYFDGTSDPATQWFDSAGRVAFVREDSAEFGRVFANRLLPVRTLGSGCLNGRDADCIALLRDFPSPGLPEPIPAMARMQVLQLALAVGGERSLERATFAHGPAEARLAAAAGIPVDSLLALWLARVHSADRASQDMSFPIALTSLFWVFVSIGLATRSSRWR